MNYETLEAIKNALNEESIYNLFAEKIGVPEDIENEDSKRYALMFNVESNELFFLPYATNENSWNKTAEGQNPWITVGFVSATDILMGDPGGNIIEEFEYKIKEQKQMEDELKNRD